MYYIVVAVVTQSTLRIVQLNAENLFIYLDHLKGDIPEKLSEKDWQALSSSSVPNKPLHKIRWLAESLKFLAPDVIILNEVGGLESLENFNAHFLDKYFDVLLIEGNSDRGIDIGYLVRKSLKRRYLLNSHKNRALNFNYPHEVHWNEQLPVNEAHKKYPSHRFSRDVLELRLFLDKSPQPELIFLACHLKSKLDREGIDPKGADRRRAEFNTLVKIYDEIHKETQGQVPIVIAGDFNGQARKSQPDHEFDKIKSTDWSDAFEVAQLPIEKRVTRWDIRNGFAPVGQQLDYIFLSPHLHPLVLSHGTFVYQYRGDMGVEFPPITTSYQQFALPSDHYPVVTTISWPKI